MANYHFLKIKIEWIKQTFSNNYKKHGLSYRHKQTNAYIHTFTENNFRENKSQEIILLSKLSFSLNFKWHKQHVK